MNTGYAEARTGTYTTAGPQPSRPGGVNDTKSNLVNRVESLQNAVAGLTQILEGAGILRPDVPSVASGSIGKDQPPSTDSALSQHIADIAKKVASVTAQIEILTSRIDV